MVRYHIGYTTGTFDVCHADHVEFLRSAKQLCHTLIVGVTTDELAQRHKRAPLVPWADRAAVVRANRYVNLVVPHRGETKAQMLRQLKFDVVFIGSDYFVPDNEYARLEAMEQGVPVIYIPRGTTTSTTDCVTRWEREALNSFTVISSGISGLMWGVTLPGGRTTVVKPIHVTAAEYREYQSSGFTGDVHEIGLARNWKGEPQAPYPMIAGINAYREIEIHARLKGRVWYPGTELRLVHVRPEAEAPVAAGQLERVVGWRAHPHAVYVLFQRHAGVTLGHWLPSSTAPDRLAVWARIRVICEELHASGLVHGDLHPANVLIHETTQHVSVVDLGWCMSPDFHMEDHEQSFYQRCLHEHFDWSHFVHSLPSAYTEEACSVHAAEPAWWVHCSRQNTV